MREGGLPPRDRSKFLQFLNSCAPSQRHNPAETTRVDAFWSSFGRFCRRSATGTEPAVRKGERRSPWADSWPRSVHRCSPESVGPLGVYLWVKEAYRATIVKHYNNLG